MDVNEEIVEHGNATNQMISNYKNKFILNYYNMNRLINNNQTAKQ